MSKQWERWLEQETQLAKEGRKTLYHRVQLLVKVYKDDQFREDNSGKDIEAFMSDRLSDACATFPELMQMIKLWPKEDQWVNGNMSVMHREMLATLSTKKKPGKQKDDETRRMSWKQRYLKLEAEHNELRAAHKQLERDYKDLRQMIQTKVA
jgi:hypothetical protein